MPRAAKKSTTKSLSMENTPDTVVTGVQKVSASTKKKPSGKNTAAKTLVKKVKTTERTKSIQIGVNTLMTKKEKKPVSPRVTKQSLVASTQELALKMSTSLSILSPFRFPIDQRHLITQTARYSGLFFIIVGAIFATYHASSLRSIPISQYVAAEAIQTTGTYGTTTQTLAPVPVQNPDVTYEVNQQSPVHGTLKITYSVVQAQKVVAQAYSQIQNSAIITLGEATKVADGKWVFEWNTLQKPDGMYKLRVMVKGENGVSYQDIDTSYIEVRNVVTDVVNTVGGVVNQVVPGTAPAPTPAPVPPTPISNVTGGILNPTTTISTVTTTIPVVVNQPRIFVRWSPTNTTFKGSVKVLITLQELPSNEVKVYARNKQTNKNNFLGNAIYRNNTELAYDWDTTLYPDGSYALYASMVTGDTSFSSDTFGVNVKNVVVTETVANGVTTTVSTVTPSPTPALTTAIIERPTLTIPEPNPVRDDTDVVIVAKNAELVELYAVANSSNVRKFIGNAVRRDSENWKFNWDTRLFTNGEFKVFAVAKTSAGLSESEGVTVKIFNEVKVVLDGGQTEAVKVLTQAAEDVKVIEQNLTLTSVQLPSKPVEEPVREEGSTDVGEEDEPADHNELIARKTNNLMAEFRKELEKSLELYSVAIRSGDEANVRLAERRIQDLRQRILKSAIENEDTKTLVAQIDDKLVESLDLFKKQITRNEEIIKERVGEKVFVDSDKDTISDYDEVNIFGTNPFGADTDGDGFNDGTEVLGGFDPKDPVAETMVQYESPKEQGSVREDILEVSEIVTLTPDPEDPIADGVKGQAVVSGKGLPNSFVSLYIFSNPIIITVKTSDDGSWNYNFDKELDDGEHEMYVAVTDNAGRIVAKSNPFKFIKEAEAFSPADAAPASVTTVAPVTQAEPRVFGENVLLLVLSFAVVVIGLVLVLLGLHVKTRQDIIPKLV